MRDTREHLAGADSWPSRTVISAPTGKPMVTEWSVPAIFTSSPRVVDQLDLRAHDLGASRGAWDR
jgi:hypothetical protein